MGKIDEIDKLIKAIADADIRLKSIQCAVEKIDKEISILGPRKNELEQNIEFHKRSDTIPIAHEYKSSKLELSKTTARLILITSDQKKAIQACKDIERILNKFNKDLFELSKIDENNVLRPVFGGRHGKK